MSSPTLHKPHFKWLSLTNWFEMFLHFCKIRQHSNQNTLLPNLLSAYTCTCMCCCCALFCASKCFSISVEIRQHSNQHTLLPKLLSAYMLLLLLLCTVLWLYNYTCTYMYITSVGEYDLVLQSQHIDGSDTHVLMAVCICCT